MSEDFGTLLRASRQRMGLSCNELARAVGVDPSYISRLERGEREPPRRRVVEGLAFALRLRLDDADRLLVAGGYAPTTVALLGHWDRTLQVVAAVIANERIDPGERAAFKTVIERIADEWGRRRSVPLLEVRDAG